MAKQRFSKPKEISVEVNGKTYTGTYRVEKGMITVTYLFSRISNHSDGTSGEVLAKSLLRKMAESGRLDR